MPDRPSSNYSLRARPHNKTLIAKPTQLNDQDFIIRSIYKDSYWLHFKHIHHASNHALYVYWLPHLLTILCISIIVYMVAFVNLILKKMVVVVEYELDSSPAGLLSLLSTRLYRVSINLNWVYNLWSGADDWHEVMMPKTNGKLLNPRCRKHTYHQSCIKYSTSEYQYQYQCQYMRLKYHSTSTIQGPSTSTSVRSFTLLRGKLVASFII